MTKPRILVTSPAGRTGSAAVLELLRKGFPVRAFVRRNDVRSETLREAGAEIFVEFVPRSSRIAIIAPPIVGQANL